MTWANVDDLFPEHPKVLAAGGDAAWLYICGLCFTNRNLTEGRVPKAVVPRLSDRKGPMRLAKTLVDVGLWHDEGDHFVIHDWDKYNENADEVKARKEHARTAARARWGGKPKPPPGSAQSMPGALPGASDEHTSGTMLDPDRAMPSHSSPTPSSSRSSSNHQVDAPPDGEEEELQERITTAVRLVAERRLSAREGPAVNDPSAWLRKVRGEVLAEHGDELRSLAGQGLHPKALADRIMPPMPTITSPYPSWAPTEEADVTDPDARKQRLADVRRGVA